MGVISIDVIKAFEPKEDIEPLKSEADIMTPPPFRAESKRLGVQLGVCWKGISTI
jgi:hypothetical protein